MCSGGLGEGGRGKGGRLFEKFCETHLFSHVAGNHSHLNSFLCFTVYFFPLMHRFDKHKGFYCQVTSQGGTHCLGKGKGRHYVPMDEKSQRFLEDYYSKPNKILADLLQKLERPLPNWLRPAR